MTAPDRDPPPESRKAGFWLVMGAVFWSFFGVRKSADHARIADSVKPQHYIFAGLLGAGLVRLHPVHGGQAGGAFRAPGLNRFAEANCLGAAGGLRLKYWRAGNPAASG